MSGFFETLGERGERHALLRRVMAYRGAHHFACWGFHPLGAIHPIDGTWNEADGCQPYEMPCRRLGLVGRTGAVTRVAGGGAYEVEEAGRVGGGARRSGVVVAVAYSRVSERS